LADFGKIFTHRLKGIEITMNHFFLRGGHAQHSFMVVGLALISYEMLASKDRLSRALDDA
jgi:hypothetical protein